MCSSRGCAVDVGSFFLGGGEEGVPGKQLELPLAPGTHTALVFLLSLGLSLLVSLLAGCFSLADLLVLACPELCPQLSSPHRCSLQVIPSRPIASQVTKADGPQICRPTPDLSPELQSCVFNCYVNTVLCIPFRY